jgi:hypothetical protein
VCFKKFNPLSLLEQNEGFFSDLHLENLGGFLWETPDGSVVVLLRLGP